MQFVLRSSQSSKIFYLRTSHRTALRAPLKPSMITIAVTGGIGAGKSETVIILERLGARTVKADLLGHAAYAKGTAGHSEVRDTFGEQVIGNDGEIDRKTLGNIVFADPTKRRALETIVWRRIREMLEATLARNAEDGVALTVIEAAVLYEAGWEVLVDRVWTVEASYHQRLARIMKNTGLPERDVRRRIDAQLAPETRIERAETTICNDGDLTQLERRVSALWETITNN